MTTELKLCVDCAACTNRYEMGRANVYRTTGGDEFHWCTRSAPDIVDGWPTVTCREMRARKSHSSPDVGWLGCGTDAALFVPRQNEQVSATTGPQ